MSHSKHRDHLSMCLLNPWSVGNKSTALCHFIIDNDLDVLALTETWLSGDSSDGPTLSNLLPPGYQILHEPRGSRGGGTAVIHKRSILVKRTGARSQTQYSSFELLECTLSLAVCIKLCLVYRPERTRQQCGGVSFFEEFGEYLSSAVTSPGQLVVMGDLNFHVDDSSDHRATAFLQLLSDSGLKQHVSTPTHRSGHILDLVISSAESSLISTCTSLDCGFPDHFPVFTDFCLEKPKAKKKLVHFRKIKAISEASIKNTIRATPLLHDFSTITNLDELVEHYDTGLTNVLDQIAYLQLRRLSSVRRYMDSATFEHLVHAFITSRLDYGNALLCGVSQCQVARLQRVQNSAARIQTGTPRRDHITPVLRSLHWLPVAARIRYKVLLLTFKCFHEIAPIYLCDLVEFYSPDRDLRSSNMRLLNVPFTTNHRCKNSAFSYVAPTLWNQLPNDVRGADTLSSFKYKLKTFLFTQYYPEL